jgi:HEAT repeat protein
MNSDRRPVPGRVFAIALLLSLAPAAFSADDPCASFRSGDRHQADACARATIAQLSPQNYNLTVGDLDGIGEPAVPALREALSSDQSLRRVAAADALGRIGMRLEGKAAIANGLASHAEDADVKVRQQVIGAIARIGVKTPAAEQAVRKAESDSDPVVRGLASYARTQLKMGEGN